MKKFTLFALLAAFTAAGLALADGQGSACTGHCAGHPHPPKNSKTGTSTVHPSTHTP